MKKSGIKNLASIAGFAFALLIGTFGSLHAQNETKTTSLTSKSSVRIIDAKKINPTTVEIEFSNQQKMLLDFYGNNIFRLFQDNSGKGLRDPQAQPEAKILLDNPRKQLAKLDVTDRNNILTLSTNAVQVDFDKNTTCFTIKNLLTNREVVKSTAPEIFDKSTVSITLSESPEEYF